MNKTAIEWTDFSASPIKFRDTEGRAAWGCIKASAGCQNCYAEAISRRYRGPGAGFTAKRMEGLTPYVDEAELKAMLSPRRLPAGSKVFVGDMTDIFGPWVPFSMLDRVFAAMALRPDVTFQVLTKRPERMREYLTAGTARQLSLGGGSVPLEPGCFKTAYDRVFHLMVGTDQGRAWRAANPSEDFLGPAGLLPKWPLPNVWLGTSTENQHWLDIRVPELLACPAAVRFVSAEPLLGPVDFGWDDWGYVERPNWVIVGGESGPGSRPFDIAWARSVVAQCRAAGVAAFVKQLGSRPTSWCVDSLLDPGYEFEPDFCDVWEASEGPRCEGRCRMLRDRKGGIMDEWPQDLRIREMPISGVSNGSR